MKRSEVPAKYLWDLTALVKDGDEFERMFSEAENGLPKLQSYAGKLGNKADCLAVLNLSTELGVIFGRLYLFANMNMHGDASNSAAVGVAARTESLLGKLMAAQAYIESELIALDESVVKAYIADADFSDYDFMLSEILRKKQHILSDKEETLLAMANDALNVSENVFGMLDNVDLKFADIKINGKKTEVTNANYTTIMLNDDRNVRKAAFNSLYDGIYSHINTIAANYAGNVKKDNFLAKARRYDNCLEQALFNDDLPTSVYQNLIDAVNNNLKSMYKYIGLRKKMLGLEEHHMYDVYTPIVKNAQMEPSYEEACEIVKKALVPLGDEYNELLNKAMTEHWIDVMPNEGKRGGAYSWGTYGVHPYVLLNYMPTTSDVFTLAHELGHCMHSYYSNKNQPAAKAEYQIFVAEVASTCNETLLYHYLMKTVRDTEVKKFLLNYRMDQFRTTLFRQTMFAEFEYNAHKMDLEGKPLTVDSLSSMYLDLNKKYYGPDMVCDDKIAYEWARIPHFYTAFYVYKYATGLTSAASIADKILQTPDYVKVYKEKFLSAGGCKSPYEILCDTGVDLATSAPYDSALAMFDSAITELDKLA